MQDCGSIVSKGREVLGQQVRILRGILLDAHHGVGIATCVDWEKDICAILVIRNVGDGWAPITAGSDSEEAFILAQAAINGVTYQE